MNQEFIFTCPQCKGELQAVEPDGLVCQTDGLRFERHDGIWRFMIPQRRSRYAQFIDEYEAVRRGEERGATSPAYYRALPYHDISGRMASDWRIRAASYDAFNKQLLTPLENQGSQPMTILDLGAGNCWLSNRLSRRGHKVAAVDLTVNDFDGLGCYRFYDANFTPIEAEYNQLPFPEQSADLIIFNASLHYSESYTATLSEALRVLTADGRLVILDSPIYQKAVSGRQMVAEREAEFMNRYGFPSNALKSENYLTYEGINKLGDSLNLAWEFITPNYGLRWRLRPLKAYLRGRREPAKFQVVVGKKR
jgi:SAM-dependent methyltransferase